MSSKQLKMASKITLTKVRVQKAPSNMKFDFQLKCFKCKHQIERNTQDDTTTIYCLGQGCEWSKQTRHPCASPTLVQGSLKVNGSAQNKGLSYQSIQVSSKQNNLKLMTQQRFGVGSYSTQNWIDQEINYVFKSNYMKYSSTTAAALRFNIENHHFLPLEIFKSQIPGAGYGIRATQELQPNRIVMPYIGAIIKSQCYVPPSDSVFDFGWLKIGRQIHPLNLQPVKKLNAARYINSCFDNGKISSNQDDFNCVMHFGIVDDSVYLFLVTKRLINKFEQLTYSYNKFYQLQKSYNKAGTVTEMIDLNLKNKLNPIKQDLPLLECEQKAQMSLMEEQFNQMCNVEEKQRQLALKQFMNGPGSIQQRMQEELDVQIDDKMMEKMLADAQPENNFVESETNGDNHKKDDQLITESQVYRRFIDICYADYWREQKLRGNKFSQAKCLQTAINKWQSLTKSQQQNLKTQFNQQIIWDRRNPKLPAIQKPKSQQPQDLFIDVQVFNKNEFNDLDSWIQTTQYNFNKIKSHTKKDWVQLCQRIFWMQLYSCSGEPYSEDFYINGYSSDTFGISQIENKDSYSCEICANFGETKILCLRRMVQHMKKQHKIFTTAVKLSKLVYSGKKFYILQSGFSQNTGLKLDSIISMTDCHKTYKNNLQKIRDNDFYYIVENHKLFIDEKNTQLRNYNQRKQDTQIQIPNQKVLERFQHIICQRQSTDDSWDNRKIVHIIYGPHGFGKTYAFRKICEAGKDRYIFNALQLTRMDTFQANILSLYRKKSYKGPLTIFIDELDSTDQSKLKSLLNKLIQLVKRGTINLYGICNVLTQKIVGNFKTSGIQVRNHVYKSYDKIQVRNFINKSLQKHGLTSNLQALDILQNVQNLRLIKDIIQRIKLDNRIYNDPEQLKKLTSSEFNYNLSSSEQNLSPNQMIIISKLLEFDGPIPKQYFDRIGLQVDVQDLIVQKVIKSTPCFIKSIDDDTNKVNVLTQDDNQKSFKMYSSRDLYNSKFTVNLLMMLEPITDFPRLSRQNRGNYLNFIDISAYRTQYQRKFQRITELYPSAILPTMTKSDVQQSKMNYFDLLNNAYLKIKDTPQSAVTDLNLWQLDYPFGRAFFVRGPSGVGKNFLIKSKLMSQGMQNRIEIDLKILQHSKKSLVEEVIHKIQKINANDYFMNKQSNIQTLIKWFNQSTKKIVLIFKNVDQLLQQCHDKTMYQLAQIMTDPNANKKLSLIFMISKMSYSLKSKVKSRIRVVDVFIHRSEGPVLMKRILKKKMQMMTEILKMSSTQFDNDQISHISNQIWHAFQNKYISLISQKVSVDRHIIFNKFHQFLFRGAAILDQYLAREETGKRTIIDSVKMMCQQTIQSLQRGLQFTDMQISVFTISIVLSQQRKLITPQIVSQFVKELKKERSSMLNILHNQTHVRKILDEMVRSRYYKVSCKNYLICYTRNELINLFKKSITQSVPRQIRDLLRERNLI